jgi:D-lactate dehydrogenase (cytochrome)
LLDEVQMAACIAYSKLEGMTASPTLFLEFHGSEASVKEQAETVEAIATDAGGAGFAWATDPEARNKLWKARHDAYWAAIASKPGSRGIATDVCLPISHLAEALLGAKEDIAASGFSAPMVGHVGDGNFHTVILVEDDRPETLAAAWALDKKIVHRALALGGTCSGEHGVGLGKREFLEVEHGMEALSVMLSVKHALDPKGILNPGKIFRN